MDSGEILSHPELPDVWYNGIADAIGFGSYDQHSLIHHQGAELYSRLVDSTVDLLEVFFSADTLVDVDSLYEHIPIDKPAHAQLTRRALEHPQAPAWFVTAAAEQGGWVERYAAGHHRYPHKRTEVIDTLVEIIHTNQPGPQPAAEGHRHCVTLNLLERAVTAAQRDGEDISRAALHQVAIATGDAPGDPTEYPIPEWIRFNNTEIRHDNLTSRGVVGEHLARDAGINELRWYLRYSRPRRVAGVLTTWSSYLRDAAFRSTRLRPVDYRSAIGEIPDPAAIRAVLASASKVTEDYVHPEAFAHYLNVVDAGPVLRSAWFTKDVFETIREQLVLTAPAWDALCRQPWAGPDVIANLRADIAFRHAPGPILYQLIAPHFDDNPADVAAICALARGYQGTLSELLGLLDS